MNNDDTYDKRFYGIYEGICTNNEDPDAAYKIKLKVPQVLGDTETNWASPCLPVTSNADHLDHLPHLASEVAALLTTHASHSVSVSGSTGAGGTPSHTHSFTASQTLTHAAHAGNTGELTHAHVTATDPLDDTDNEHTPHRKVPNVAQKVWVMFIAGDPNFPVWMGVAL
jgi:hypothetical protein